MEPKIIFFILLANLEFIQASDLADISPRNKIQACATPIERSWLVPDRYRMSISKQSEELLIKNELVTLPLYSFPVFETKSLPCDDSKLEFASDVKFSPEGYVQLTNESHKSYIPSEYYCIQDINEGAIKYCKQDSGDRDTPRCCLRGQLLHTNGAGQCTTATDPFSIPIYEDLMDEHSVAELDGGHRWVPPTSFNCHIEWNTINKSEFRVLQNGAMFIKYGTQWYPLPGEDVCIEGVLGSESIKYPDCFDPTELEEINTKKLVNQIRIPTVNIPCTLLNLCTVLVYVSLWDLQRLHGWIIIALTASLATRYLVLTLLDAPILYADWNIVTEALGYCIFLGMSHQFSFISCYCWTIVLTYDVWRRLKPLRIVRHQGDGFTRFACYSLFGFGMPLLNVALASVLQWGVSHSTGLAIHQPRYDLTCLVQPDSYFFYMSIPTILLITINVLLVAASLYRFWMAKRQTAVLRQEGNSSTRALDNLAFMAFKLFLLMGGLLLFDAIVYYSGVFGKTAFSIILEILFRVGHSAALFWLLVINASTVRKQLKERFQFFKGENASNMAFGSSSAKCTASTNDQKNTAEF